MRRLPRKGYRQIGQHTHVVPPPQYLRESGHLSQGLLGSWNLTLFIFLLPLFIFPMHGTSSGLINRDGDSMRSDSH